MESNKIADLTLLEHADTDSGVCRFNLSGFNNVYRYVRRIIERTGQDVQMVLFTIVGMSDVGEDAVRDAVDKLEQAIFNSLRRSDVSTRYSSTQVITILMDADAANGERVVERILKGYRELSPDPRITVYHDSTRIEGRYVDRDEGFARGRNEKKTILIVDDDKTNLISAKNALSDLYKVIAVPSGAMAIRFFESGVCDLVLLDINMPGMDGFETMKKIREQSAGSLVPIIFLTADNDPETENRCLEEGAVDYIAKPFVLKVLRSRISRTLELEDYRKNLQKKVAEKTARITYIQDMTVLGMATMVESRDNSTGGHIKRTGDVVKVFTRHLYDTGFLCDADYVRKIVRGAPMHDLGKIAIDDKVLRKNGKFTDEEYNEMKRHSAEGAKVIETMLRGVDEDSFVDIAVNIARHHHERWDGKGYPDGLAGEAIPLEARIMALADVFDALASRRCYKPAFTYDQTFAIIEESLGTQFDPELGRMFLDCREELISLYDNYTSI